MPRTSRKRSSRKGRKTSKPRRGALVTAFAEGLSATVLEKYKKEFKAVVGRKSGIYILTKGKKIYYVGLASNLTSRLATHLRDRHDSKWNRFSFYSIGRKKFIKDVETILIRVLRPAGNTQGGRFGPNKNLNSRIVEEILAEVAKGLGAR